MAADSILNVSRTNAHLASILLMLLTLPKLLNDFQDLDQLPENIAMTIPSLRKSRICFMYELPNLHLHIIVVRHTVSCQGTENILPRNRFVLMSGNKKFSLLMTQSTLRRFALIIQSFSWSLCNKLNSFLKSKNCKYNSKLCTGTL